MCYLRTECKTFHWDLDREALVRAGRVREERVDFEWLVIIVIIKDADLVVIGASLTHFTHLLRKDHGDS